MEWNTIYMLMNFVIVSIVSYYIGRWDGKRKMEKM